LAEFETDDKISKLENKIKLSNLLTGKKFADLELNIGKFEGRLNQFFTDFNRIKEKTEEIEDLLNVINIGIMGYKEKLEEISSQVSGTPKLPEDILAKLADYGIRLNSLNESFKRMSETISSLRAAKEDMTKSLDKTFVQNIENLRRDTENNKLEMGHIKKDLDAFSSTIKSFERSLDSMNFDSLTKRFDSVNAKITDIEKQIQESKNSVNNLTFAGEDVKVFKNRMDELEKKVRIIKQKTDDLKFFDKTGRSQNITDEYKIRIDELTIRIDALSDEVRKLSTRRPVPDLRGGWDDSEPVEEETPEEPSFDHAEVEEKYNKIKDMYDEIFVKVDEIKELQEKVRSKELEDVGGSHKLTHDAAREISRLNQRIVNIEKKHNELVDILQAELQTMKEFSSGKEVTHTLDFKNLDQIEKAIASRDKNLEEYKKQVDKKFKSLESMKSSGLPKNLIDEIIMMRENIVRLTTENKELRKLGREIRMSQLESINLQTFNALSEKVRLLEKKIIEVEESLNKEASAQTQRKEIIENLRKEIEDSKKIIESKFETKIGKIEKKLKEEDLVKPIILE